MHLVLGSGSRSVSGENNKYTSLAFDPGRKLLASISRRPRQFDSGLGCALSTTRSFRLVAPSSPSSTCLLLSARYFGGWNWSSPSSPNVGRLWSWTASCLFYYYRIYAFLLCYQFIAFSFFSSPSFMSYTRRPSFLRFLLRTSRTGPCFA